MEKVSSARIALKWGIIYGIISMLSTTILYNTELWKNWGFTAILGLLISFTILYFSLNEYKLLNNGFISYGEGLGLGTLTAATGGIIGVVYDFIYKKYIDPNIINLQLEMSMEQYESMGYSDELLEKSMETAERFTNSGLAFLISVFVVIFFGFVASLIMAAVLKKDKPVFS
jgi:uncharacterized membrane protein